METGLATFTLRAGSTRLVLPITLGTWNPKAEQIASSGPWFGSYTDSHTSAMAALVVTWGENTMSRQSARRTSRG